jgi:diketogulonate reductase-like aldo/keto reductase
MVTSKEHDTVTELSFDSTVKLRTGIKIPVVGFGVWQIPPGAPTRKSVATALQTGYRHIDTAKIYENEADVGDAIKESGIPREDIFLTTKLWNDDQGYATTLAACDASLAKLKTDYVDLYLIHWPLEGKSEESWRALLKLKEQGKARAIGVSNFKEPELDGLIAATHEAPEVDQIKFNPFTYQRTVQEYCRSKAIGFEAHMPLNRAARIDDPVVAGVAKKYSKSPAQVLLRWGLQKGAVILPRSQRPEHIRENTQVFDFELARPDIAALDALDETSRPK